MNKREKRERTFIIHTIRGGERKERTNSSMNSKSKRGREETERTQNVGDRRIQAKKKRNSMVNAKKTMCLSIFRSLACRHNGWARLNGGLYN